MLIICAEVAERSPNLAPRYIAARVYKLSRIARSLHKRYEAACSYEWANTEAYEKRTESLELKAMQVGLDLDVVVTHQRDPRGWPLIIYSRGGKSNTNPPSHLEQQEIGRLG